MDLLLALPQITKETAETTVAILTGLGMIGYVLYSLWKNFPKFLEKLVGKHFSEEKENHVRAASYRKKANPRVRAILSDLVEELDADRGLLLEFENGNSNNDSIPVKM